MEQDIVDVLKDKVIDVDVDRVMKFSFIDVDVEVVMGDLILDELVEEVMMSGVILDEMVEEVMRFFRQVKVEDESDYLSQQVYDFEDLDEEEELSLDSNLDLGLSLSLSGERYDEDEDEEKGLVELILEMEIEFCIFRLVCWVMFLDEEINLRYVFDGGFYYLFEFRSRDDDVEEIVRD